jgi:general secretion pathway protein D
MKSFSHFLAAAVLTVVAGACARDVRVRLPEPLPEGRAPREQSSGNELISGTGPRRSELVRSATPTPPGSGPLAAGLDYTTPEPPLRDGEPINVNIEGMPVPAFIDHFFGEILGVTYQIDPALANIPDLVTLRTSSPQSPRNFYRLALQVLRTYGVVARYEGRRLLFLPAEKAGGEDPPLILSGRALPDVPVTHRPVFQLVELQAVRIADVTQWLRTAFKAEGLEIQEDLNRNAVVLYGRPALVRQAMEAIQVLDRPYMRGRVSARLEPAFVPAGELAARLVEVLSAEGYAASISTGQGLLQATSVIVMPVTAANVVLIFAPDARIVDHAVEWARTIDRPNPAAGGSSLFYYLVKNTRAEDIVATLNGVRSASRTPVRTALSSAEAFQPVQPDGQAAAGNAAGPETAVAGGSISGGQIVLDAPRNAIIFNGPPADWERILTLVRQMDRAARQVMIEVTIAEVSLDDNEEFGVAWLAKGPAGRFGGTLTSGVLAASGAGGGFGGLTYLLDVGGQNRAQLRAFAQDNRVNILSTPRLLVKSGEEASIDVGTEVPTIAAQTASVQQTEGTSNILQSIQYRKTGIILNVKPVVYSDDRIDLEIRQEVSEALPLGTDSVVQSPSIFNRAVSTSLSLRDGSSILIGGLMSRRASLSEGGVPLLKDIPLLGHAFKTTNRRANKTELVLMIVPYIVESDDQATALTRSIGTRLEMLEIPSAPETPPPLVPSRPSPVTEGVD